MWILMLSLFSNPDGNYTQTFKTEKECVIEMGKFMRKNDGNTDIKYVGCMSAAVASNESEE